MVNPQGQLSGGNYSQGSHPGAITQGQFSSGAIVLQPGLLPPPPRTIALEYNCPQQKLSLDNSPSGNCPLNDGSSHYCPPDIYPLACIAARQTIGHRGQLLPNLLPPKFFPTNWLTVASSCFSSLDFKWVRDFDFSLIKTFYKQRVTEST